MRQFKDKDSGQWLLDLTVAEIQRVKAASDGRFNLISPSAQLADELADDELVFWELLWHLVEPQAVTKQVSAEMFGQLMAADCLHQAREQFFAEWSDFFRQLHRHDKQAVVEAAAMSFRKRMELVQAKLNGQQMQQLETLVERRMQTSWNESFGKLLASLESTPALLPGDSSTN